MSVSNFLGKFKTYSVLSTMKSFICIEEVGLNRETQRLNKYGYTEFYPASRVLSYFFSTWHGEARETLQNLCIFFVEPTIQKLG